MLNLKNQKICADHETCPYFCIVLFPKGMVQANICASQTDRQRERERERGGGARERVCVCVCVCVCGGSRVGGYIYIYNSLSLYILI